MTDPAVPPPAPAPAAAGRFAVIAFGVLALATLGAFFLASRLKAQPAVLTVTRAVTFFSPNGDGVRDREPLVFEGDVSDDDAEVDVIDADGVQVARVAEGRRIRPGRPVAVVWDGRDDAGRVVPDGPYRIRVTLGGDGRSLLAPRRFFVDTTPPSPRLTIRRRDIVVRPGQPVRFAVTGVSDFRPPRYSVVRTDRGPQRIVARFEGEKGALSGRWDGRLTSGAAAPVGTYLIAVEVRDKAGNLGRSTAIPAQTGQIRGRPGFTVRTVAVQPPVRPVRAGTVTSFRVDARGRRYGWTLRKVGSSRILDRARRPKRSTTLVVRAPTAGTGAYLLTVSSRGDETTVPFAVQGRGHAPLTVVLPTITWLAQDPVQDSGEDDGLPDVLSAARPVPYPRVFGYPGGLPDGFADDVAPLLVWLERNAVPYDLTTDLALSLDDQPARDAKGGLLFAGAPRYVSSGLARRLRAYVAAGGRVGLFGSPSLRAAVTVADRRLTRGTAVGPRDAFGGTLAPPRRLAGGEPLSVTRDEGDSRALVGFSGTLGGFSRAEELASPGEGKVLAAIAQPLTEEEAAKAERDNVSPRPERPVFSVVRQGEGLVVRIGVDGWVSRLATDDAAVSQLTFNAVDLLRGARPRPRTARG